jgi:hypothetical protein
LPVLCAPKQPPSTLHSAHRTAVMRAGAVRERRLRNVITEGLGVVLDRRRSVTAGARGAMPW